MQATADDGRDEQLVGYLRGLGIPDAQIEKAAAEHRLALLGAEWLLTREAQLTIGEVARRASVGPQLIDQMVRGLGLAPPAPDEPRFGEADVAAFTSLGVMRAAGMSPEGMLDVARVVGHGLWRISEAVRDLIGETFASEDDGEHLVAMRYAAAAEHLTPHMTPLLEAVFRAHLVDGIRSDIVAQSATAARDVGVAFADLVGFTGLGQELAAGELGRVADHFAKVASRVVGPPVRLVKTIGDAVMLVSHDMPELAATVTALVDEVERDNMLTRLRAGMSYGPAVARGGDWFGDTVNVASRLAGRAPAGAILATGTVRIACGSPASWVALGALRLRGRKDAVEVFGVERRAADDP